MSKVLRSGFSSPKQLPGVKATADAKQVPRSNSPTLEAAAAHVGMLARSVSTFKNVKKAGSTQLFLALRVRALHLDVARGHTEVGMRIFGFWKSDMPFEVGTVLRQKHGDITPEIEQHIPDIQVVGKVAGSAADEADKEIKFHHLQISIDGEVHETDTMVTIFQQRVMEDIFQLHDFPFDEQHLELLVRLPKSNAKDAHFRLRVTHDLHVDKENIRPRLSGGQGALDITENVRKLLLQQWTILSSELHAGHTLERPSNDRAMLMFHLRRKHEYYLARMLVPSGVCASLAMTAWNVEHHAFGERAAILVTLFLALVASTTSYAANLPKLPYLTQLDKYLNACLGFTTMVTVGCVAGTPRGAEMETAESASYATRLGSELVSAQVDRWIMLVLSSMWILYNMWYFGGAMLREELVRRKAAKQGSRYSRLA